LYKYKVNTGSCYDSIAESKLRNFIPKSVSFVTDAMLQSKKKVDPFEEAEKQQALMA
jgi:hypothetical protein